MSKRLLLLSSLLVLLLLVTPQSPTIAASACPSGSGHIQLDNGLLTTVKDPTTAQNVFSTSGQCILSNPAAIPQFSLISYADMESLYFSQSKSAAKLDYQGNLGEGGLSEYLNGSSPKSIIHTTGFVSINNNISGSNTAVVFVDGNLYFASPLENFTYGNERSGIVFVVQGDVNIAQSVKRIDAVIITYGQFCSSWDGSGCSPYNNPLTIYGSVITLNSSKPPSFLRQNDSNDPDHPGELIIFEPKYLVILKDVFAKTLQIWSELTTEQ